MNHAIEHELSDQAKAAAGIMDILRAHDEADDAELIDGMVEGETGFMEALDAALAEMDACDVTSEGCKAVITTLNARKARADARRDKVRAAIEQAMLIADISEKIVRPTATLTLAKHGPVRVVDDESRIPARFFVPQPPKLDKTALKTAADGEEIPGTRWTNGSVSLTVRRK